MGPKRLLFAYLLGAWMTSITLGLVIVFVVGGSSSGTSSAKHTVNPVLDIALGLLILVIAFVVGTGRDHRRRVRRERKQVASVGQAPPRWKQALSGGTARTTFVVGALLTLPGASYLAALDLIAKQNDSTSATVAIVVGFNLVMLILLELPLLGYVFRPEGTAVVIARFSAGLSRDGGRVALVGAVVIGVALIARGTAGLLN